MSLISASKVVKGASEMMSPQYEAIRREGGYEKEEEQEIHMED